MLLDFRYMLHLEKILNNKSEDKPRFNFDNKKLSKPSKIRTFCVELHNVLNNTKYNIYKQLLNLKQNLYNHKIYNYGIII